MLQSDNLYKRNSNHPNYKTVSYMLQSFTGLDLCVCQVCHASAIQHCKLASKLNVLAYLDKSKQQYLMQAWALACYSTFLFIFTMVFNCVVCIFSNNHITLLCKNL